MYNKNDMPIDFDQEVENYMYKEFGYRMNSTERFLDTGDDEDNWRDSSE